MLDLPMREADVAIRMKEPSQADLIRRRLMEVRIRLYASRAYVEQHGLPRTAEELAEPPADHPEPDLAAGARRRRLRSAVPRAGSLLVAGGEQLLRHPAGRDPRARHRVAARLPDRDFPDLVNILPDANSAPIPAYLAYVEELRHSKRVCAFRDFMLEEIAAFKREGEVARTAAL